MCASVRGPVIDQGPVINQFVVYSQTIIEANPLFVITESTLHYLTSANLNLFH